MILLIFVQRYFQEAKNPYNFRINAILFETKANKSLNVAIWNRALSHLIVFHSIYTDYCFSYNHQFTCLRKQNQNNQPTEKNLDYGMRLASQWPIKVVSLVKIHWICCSMFFTKKYMVNDMAEIFVLIKSNCKTLKISCYARTKNCGAPNTFDPKMAIRS